MLDRTCNRRFHENLVHYNWHWFWNYGNGGYQNQGVHQIDIARWMIPGAVWPEESSAWRKIRL